MSSSLKCYADHNEFLLIRSQSSPVFIGSIDQGTSSTRFILFNHLGQIIASAQMSHKQIYPSNKIGWHEQDPIEIWRNTLKCVRSVISIFKKKSPNNFNRNFIKAIGIANQRETTIAWNAATGAPYYNAIVWDDIRTIKIASDIALGNPDRFRRITGLPITSYFPGIKVRWLVENVRQLRLDLVDPTKCQHVRFGTIDTWLIYQLTGKESPSNTPFNANIGGRFITDVSNASRWLFLNIQDMNWDYKLIYNICYSTGIQIPISSLPKVMASSHVYDKCCLGFGANELENVPIAGILGDQQASLFGHRAFKSGQAKNTYGTGLFLLMNTGQRIVSSSNGLLTTVAYKIGRTGDIIYALEGSVSHSGSTLHWLRDKLRMIRDTSDSEKIAEETTSNNGLYFVPAFSGLFAPYWRSDARACIFGITINHTYNHFVRAALEASTYQTRELFESIYFDTNMILSELHVDGGATKNNFLMQFQADILGIPLVRSVIKESTALGVALASGLAVGVWNDIKEVRCLFLESITYLPSIKTLERCKSWTGWRQAVRKSFICIDEKYCTLKRSMFLHATLTATTLIIGLSIGAFIAKTY